MTETIRTLDKIEVDLVLSVGYSCRTAHRMREFNLREASSPLDWMVHYSLDDACDLMVNDFKTFFLEYENQGIHDGGALQVMDKKTKMISIHHFTPNEDLDTQVANYRALSIQRWEKIKAKIASVKRIALIYNGAFDKESFGRFLNKFSSYFGKEKMINFINVDEDKSKAFNELKITQYKLNSNINIIHYLGNDYPILSEEIWEGNSFLWNEVMKNIELNHKSLPNALEKVKEHLAYKLGEAFMMNYRSFLGLMFLPFIFYGIYKRHNFLKSKELLNLKLSENYKNYEQALALKNGLYYKVGLEIIKAYQNKWGGVKLPFTIRKLILEDKNQSEGKF